MFDISREGIVTLTRGDSFSCPVFINQGTELTPVRYIPTDNDKIYFGLMEPNQSFENAIVKKVYTDNDLNEHGDIILSFNPSDTEHLLPGTYYYSLKLKTNITEDRYEVNTIIPERKFELRR